ncbi:GAF and ANTAR domain-containing protein [Nocardiopsis ansamitocini]|uniref:Transcription antitermination regulator n=1 Tax=Nocardiopsis ansamitocini TaxID=1670832 RepID=A0A9W6P4I0_9ACTN|nr:GAF and ANTAR domain-containing protein [Nocardiopsis ansamitocini]GLU47185.1 transcription antitermination regulator [Nocardiopsis ansamitocini]
MKRPGPPDMTPDELYGLLISLETVEEQLAELARIAVRTLPGRVHCGVTLRHRGRSPITIASSDETAAQLDEAQYAREDGPCLQCLRTGERVVVEDMTTEQRWGDYGARSVASGVLSLLAEPIHAGPETLGALNLYGAEPGLFDDAHALAIASFAQRASGMLTIMRRLSDERRTTHQLREALNSRTVIDQAMGIIMAQARCSAEAAFDLLRQASHQRNRKLREVAADVITAVTGEPPRVGREFTAEE